MSKYLGDFALGQTVRFMASTSAANGGRVDPSSAFEAADFRVYRNGNVAQRASEAGYTVTSTFDSMTGITYVAIDTADNTDAGFFVAGADYSVVAYPDEKVDSQDVAACVAEFSIENRFGSIATLPALSVGAHPLLGIVDSGVAQAVSGTTLRLRAATEFTNDDVNNGCVIKFRGSSGGWQIRAITDYNSTTKDVTFDSAVFTPSGTITYLVLASAPVSASQKFPATVAAGDIAPAAIAEVQSGLATASALATLTAYVDTEIAAILAAVDTEVAAIKAKTDALPAAPAGAGDQMAMTSVAQLALVKAIFLAANGGSGFKLVKDVANSRVVLSMPGESDVYIPAVFAESSPAVESLGA